MIAARDMNKIKPKDSIHKNFTTAKGYHVVSALEANSFCFRVRSSNLEQEES